MRGNFQVRFLGEGRRGNTFPLPDHMRDATELREALVGQHRIQTDTAAFVANITSVMVMPQPYGTVYSKMLTPNGTVDPCHTATRTGVVDVGTYTVDLALDDDGEYVDSESGSVESGVFTAQERIAALLERDYRQKMSPALVESVLRTGCFRASGKVVDYKHEVQAALEPLRSATLNLMAEKWKAAKHIDVIYLSGGGAALVADALLPFYEQAEIVKEAQLANARGYLNFALFRQNQSQ